MRSMRNFLVIGFIVLIAYWYFQPTTSETKPTEKLQEQAATTSEPSAKKITAPSPPPTETKVAEPIAPKTIAAPPKVQGSAEPAMPKHAVPFRIVNGLFVAYGDIVLGKPLDENVPDEGFAESPKPQKWNSEIPYLISPDLENPEPVYKVVEYFNENTPIHFVPAAENARDAIVFEPTDEHCFSYLGRIGGHQPVYLSKNCFEPEITHEIMHVLGFVHEQSRPDRAQYLTIHWDRIEEDKKPQFLVVPEELAGHVRSRPFDYNSVMLYRPTAFAKNAGEVTLESTTEQIVDPVRTGLSAEDMERIRKIYPPKEDAKELPK
jgi:hypothetical protein